MPALFELPDEVFVHALRLAGADGTLRLCETSKDAHQKVAHNDRAVWQPLVDEHRKYHQPTRPPRHTPEAQTQGPPAQGPPPNQSSSLASEASSPSSRWRGRYVRAVARQRNLALDDASVLCCSWLLRFTARAGGGANTKPLAVRFSADGTLAMDGFGELNWGLEAGGTVMTIADFSPHCVSRRSWDGGWIVANVNVVIWTAHGETADAHFAAVQRHLLKGDAAAKQSAPLAGLYYAAAMRHCGGPALYAPGLAALAVELTLERREVEARAFALSRCVALRAPLLTLFPSTPDEPTKQSLRGSELAFLLAFLPTDGEDTSEDSSSDESSDDSDSDSASALRLPGQNLTS
ncbi:hypothetical protein M885DRAFT_619205 [Pelagophyceae sp. CCMP2097]|nr:hypothetical protein M885DRAFT_619205 [Pelagophyceae sp. CCMP2097]